MSEELYSQLPQGSIRLLRLLPSEKESDELRCELFEYPLQNAGKFSHPYEALSYVWGSEDKPNSIAVNNCTLNVTPNLYTALLHLRDYACSRVMWIDAICIDQNDNKEKEHQLPLMAEIYAKAYRVVAWLGDAEGGIDRALELLRLAGENPAKLHNAERSIKRFLQRPWFQRIWVLQEMAAARHVLIMCGSSEIDGHALCLGLDSLGETFQEAMSQVTFLIRGAIFRPRSMLKGQGRVSLDICSLGELADMYHTYRATKPHDKIYALLGMCSDDLSEAGLEPDYSLPWELLMQRVTKFLLSDHVSVDIWNEKRRVIIKSKGCVLGKVTAIDIKNGNGVGSGQMVEITTNSSSGYKIDKGDRWLLQTSAKSVRRGDLVCLLQGVLKPKIIRPWGDHFIIVVIEPVDLKHREVGDAQWSELAQPASFIRDFLLVWDWETSFENQDPGPYNALMRANDLQSQHAQTESQIDINNAIRRWNIAQILGDVKELTQAREKKKKAAEFFQAVIREGHTHSLECQCSQIPLLWAAESGEASLVDLLLATDDSDPDLEDYHSRTPLSWAAEQGHKTIVKLLIKTAKVEVDSKDNDGRTPLSWAAERGHEAVVKMLIETRMVDVDLKDKNEDRTPLSYAAERGHEAVAKILVDTGSAEVNLKDAYSGWTPLSYAAAQGHEAIVKMLIETGKVDVDSINYHGQTPLSLAADQGHEAIVKMLIETGKVEVDSKLCYRRTPLSRASAQGHEAIVKMLIETGMVDVDLKDESEDRTPLSYAAERGHIDVVKMLMDTGKVEVDSKDKFHRLTPLSWAAERGHEAIVKMLIETGRVNVDSKDRIRQTPLLRAAVQGHEAIVKILIETDKVNVDLKDYHGRTPLSYAVEREHEAVVKILIDTGSAEVNLKDVYSGWTPLSYAAAQGHEAIVKMLIEMGKADVNSKDYFGRTPLSLAASGGHEAILEQLKPSRSK